MAKREVEAAEEVAAGTATMTVLVSDQRDWAKVAQMRDMTMKELHACADIREFRRRLMIQEVEEEEKRLSGKWRKHKAKAEVDSDGPTTTMAVFVVDQQGWSKVAKLRGVSLKGLFASDDVREFRRHLMLHELQKEAALLQMPKTRR